MALRAGVCCWCGACHERTFTTHQFIHQSLLGDNHLRALRRCVRKPHGRLFTRRRRRLACRPDHVNLRNRPPAKKNAGQRPMDTLGGTLRAPSSEALGQECCRITRHPQRREELAIDRPSSGLLPRHRVFLIDTRCPADVQAFLAGLAESLQFPTRCPALRMTIVESIFQASVLPRL